jgi:hypothetical protein
MNNLNKNKLILKTKDNTNNNNNNPLVQINKEKINLIGFQPNLKIKSSSKKITAGKKITTSKKITTGKKIKQKRTPNINTTPNTNTTPNDNIEFPHGDKYKCIGPCYPANMLYYHPLTLQAIKSKSNSCPVKQQKIGDKIKIKDKCVLNENFDYEGYDMFADVVQVATSDNAFLEQIYNIKNIYDVELFLENNIKQLPNLSQKRILNSIYKVYRDNDSFPSNNFISLIKALVKKNYDIDIKSKIILGKIMDNKHGKKWNDLFLGLLE